MRHEILRLESDEPERLVSSSGTWGRIGEGQDNREDCKIRKDCSREAVSSRNQLRR